jgi:hypothetical protein
MQDKTCVRFCAIIYVTRCKEHTVREVAPIARTAKN